MLMPLALLMTTRLPSVLAGVVKTIDYVESTGILGVPTQHIAGPFEFVPPPGSKQIPFAVQVLRSAESERRPGANGEVEP
jgi:hypothetical protein